MPTGGQAAYPATGVFMEPALTNYFACGASCWTENSNPKRGLIANRVETYNGWESPSTDAVMGPVKSRRIADVIDGASNTAFLVESRETNCAAWADGNVAAVVSLLGMQEPVININTNPKFPNVRFPTVGGTAGARTALNKGGVLNTADNTGPGDVYAPAGSAYTLKWFWGPSSEHNSTVNHVFGDGRATSISDNVDVQIYYAYYTRAGNEPPQDITN
jgi:hypothetical protein